MTTLQAPLPEQAPLQPSNPPSATGVAVSDTGVCVSKDAVQLDSQSMPFGDDTTRPLPATLTVSCARVLDGGVSDLPALQASVTVKYATSAARMKAPP